MTRPTMFERPVVFKFTIGDRVEVKPHLHLRATGCTKKAYDLTYPAGFMVVDLTDGIHGPDYHCEPLVEEPHARTMWIEEKYLKKLDTV
jgi:hypothetical protein